MAFIAKQFLISNKISNDVISELRPYVTARVRKTELPIFLTVHVRMTGRGNGSSVFRFDGNAKSYPRHSRPRVFFREAIV